jgi:DNA-binding NarL/FixJ family response regulator
MAQASGEEITRPMRNEVRPIDAPTRAERELLTLLAAGATHETVAHRLDIPLRTTRRRIAALMKQLGAVSPFQAGAEAARRGWLVVPANQPLIDDSGQVTISLKPFNEAGTS